MAGRAKVRWTLTISAELDADLRTRLGVEGSSEELSAYVEQAVAKEMFFNNLNQIHEQNRHLDPDQLQRDIDEAVREVREESRQELAAQSKAS